MMYTPILKWKEGERLALKELDDHRRECVRPLLVIDDTDRWSRFAPTIGSVWPGGRLALDFGALVVEEVEGELRGAIDKMREAGITWQLVLRPDMSPDLVELIEDTAADANVELVVRIALEDVGELLREPVDNAAEIILDLGELNAENFRVKEQLAAVHLQEIANEIRLPVTLAGSAALRDVGGLDQDVHNMVERLEWGIWRRLREQFRDLRYGDYATVSPVPSDVDPRVMRPVAKIIYTRDEHWIVWRGVRVHGAGPGFAQYFDLAGRVVASTFYRGEDFSFGDGKIAQAARHEGTTGNLRTWVTVAVNHHMAEICELLASQGVS